MIMRNFYLQPVSEMENISRAEFGEKLDYYLERVIKEDIGFVIKDEGKPSLVVCQADWVQFCFDDDFGDIAMCAFRYALGRKTSVPFTICNFLKRYGNMLEPRVVTAMIKELEDSFKNENLPELKTWQELYTVLVNRNNEYNAHKKRATGKSE
jgi:hypothetical protein